MRFISAEKLEPGMVVGRTLYNGMSILLNSGVMLTESYINAVRRININGIYIEDDQTKDIEIKPLIDDEVKVAFTKKVEEIFTSTQPKIRSADTKFEDVVKNIIEQIVSKSNHVVNMFELKVVDNYTFQHSIDVCILSVVMGINKQLKYSLLYDLALAAVYHDIGKMHINQRILEKRGPLTASEYAEIKEHPVLGVEHIKKMGIKQSHILTGILHHHERYDGTGYPNALTDQKISLFGKIIAIADVFDAIVSERPYKHAMPPSEAVEYIMANANQHFDMEVSKLFISSVAAYPVGVTVRLSNGNIGVVAENYSGYTLRPLVKLLPDSPEDTPVYINLKDDVNAQNITILGIV